MIYHACLGLISIIKPWLQHPKCHDALQVLYLVWKKKNSKSLVGLQALIYSWSVYDIPSEVLLLCSSPSTPSLPFLSKQLLSLPCLLAVPGPVPDHAALQWAHAPLCWWLPAAAVLLLALRCHCSQGLASPLPTDATSVSWDVGLEAISVRSQAEPCSAKDRLFGGRVQNANFCSTRRSPELVSSNWKTILFLAELSLGSFPVSL